MVFSRNLTKSDQLFGATFTRPESFENLTGDTEFWSDYEDLGEYTIDGKS